MIIPFLFTLVFMKIPKLLLLACSFLTASLYGQTPKSVEADLLKSYKRLNYFGQKYEYDSVAVANSTFSNKINMYTKNNPFTISQPFNLLRKEGIDIVTSDDGLFRIYSWDDQGGGTMRWFNNIFQYKAGYKVMSMPDNNERNDPGCSYSKLYTFNANGKTYYLGIYHVIGSSKDVGTGMRVFAIENGRLNTNVKLIKTQTALRSELYYGYDFFSVVNIPFERRPTITFNAASQTIKMPLVDDKEKVTNKFIAYKFTGKYFEKVKSR